MCGAYFKSSIVQYSIVPEYIAVRERHYDMTRVGILQLGTRKNRTSGPFVSEQTSMLDRGLVCV